MFRRSNCVASETEQQIAIKQPFQRIRKRHQHLSVQRNSSQSVTIDELFRRSLLRSFSTVIIHVTSLSGDIYMSHALVCSELQLPHNPGYPNYFAFCCAVGTDHHHRAAVPRLCLWQATMTPISRSGLPKSRPDRSAFSTRARPRIASGRPPIFLAKTIPQSVCLLVQTTRTYVVGAEKETMTTCRRMRLACTDDTVDKRLYL